MEQIRVSTFADPGTQPVIHSVPRPKISSKAQCSQPAPGQTFNPSNYSRSECDGNVEYNGLETMIAGA